MSVMQIRCDCCGEIIETGHHKLTLKCELRPAISSRDSATSDPAIDLCKPCFDDLHEWFAESWSSTIPEGRHAEVDVALGEDRELEQEIPEH